MASNAVQSGPTLMLCDYLEDARYIDIERSLAAHLFEEAPFVEEARSGRDEKAKSRPQAGTIPASDRDPQWPGGRCTDFCDLLPMCRLGPISGYSRRCPHRVDSKMRLQ